MNFTLLAILAGLLLCTLSGARFDAFVAAGIWTGYLAGSGLGLINALWQRHQVRVRPERVMAATVIGFLIKLAGALLGALVLRYVEPLPELADWRGYLVAFASAAFLMLVFGSLDNARQMKREAAL